MLFHYLLYALAAAYFAWRLLVNLRRREDIRRQVSALTFLAAFALFWVIGLIFPGIGGGLAAALLLLFFGAAAAANLYLFRRYDRWLEDQDAEQ